MPRIKKILFVCTGNSCRSVMAEGLLKHLLGKKGKTDIHVLSAGIGTYGGLGATPETIEVMKKQGIDVSQHVSQPLTPDLIHHAEAIFCMEDYHYNRVLELMPPAAGKVFLLKPFESKTPVMDPNIPDPIGRPKEVYESCLLTIKEAVEKVAKWLEKQS